MINDTQRAILYNYDNMPTYINYNGATTQLVYDGQGNRVKKIAGATNTVYISKFYEVVNSGESYSKYIFAGNTRIALRKASVTRYYHQDHLGSSSVITNASGNNVEEIQYLPFGSAWSDTNATLTTHKFTGQALDAETGLYYYGARYYNPLLGRFISADTIVGNPGDPQDLNKYTYAGNNPLLYTDPTGHFKFSSFFKNYGGTIASVAFTFAGMPYVGAFAGSAINTALNDGSIGDFAIGLGVGMASGYAGGSISGSIARSAGMNLAGIETALLRGGLSGSIAGAGTSAIYGGNIGKGALRGAFGGAAVGAAMWGVNTVRTNNFLKNNVKWDSSVSAADRATYTQAISEAGQSPLGQRTFAKYMGSGRTITIHSINEVGGYVPDNSPSDIYLNPDISATQNAANMPSYVQAQTLDMATLMLHEMGHSSTYNGTSMMGDPLNVSYHENPYRAWIGTPSRTGYYSAGDVEFKQWLYQY
ncbi:MAG: repeat protein [Candidatus Brocadiaceae bacterium]|nr:repeat protein [Candidatus Brocadiaceae bacterium]